MTFEGAQASAVEPQPAPFFSEDSDPISCHLIVGPAKPGYRRSLALIHQLNLINSENTGVDYYLFPVDLSKEPVAVILQELPVSLFRPESATDVRRTIYC